MDSPGSDDERLREAAAGEAMLTKKMKLLIIMLSLVLIILLVPLASNHGLPLLRPMGISVLQRLWDAMRFIAMTAAISIGIISTSNSQRNNKGFDGSAHHRSSSSIRRSSAPIASGDRESINPKMNNSIDMNRSASPNNRQWQNIARGDVPLGRSEEMGDSQKLKGKEVMNDLPFAASTSDASFNSSTRGEIIELEKAQSRLAPNLSEHRENFKQRPMKINITNSRRRLSAGDIWFVAPRIDEEEDEEYISASAGHGDIPPTSRSRGESHIRKVELQNKASSSMIDEKNQEQQSKKEIRTSADRSSMSAFTSMTDEYAELRMRRAAIPHLADDENGKGQRRSSSVDRRRPIKYDYDKQSPDQPGLKQILMDLSKERASKVKLSNLSSGSQANQRLGDVREGSNRPHPTHARIDPAPSVQQTMKANVHPAPSVQHTVNTNNVHHHQSSVVATANVSSAIVKNAKMGSSQIASNQTPHKLVQAKIGSTQALQKDNARMGSDQISQSQAPAQSAATTGSVVSEGMVQTRRRQNDAKDSTHIVQTSEYQEVPQKATMSSTSKLLMQSSKHSRSDLNLQQLEQIGNSSSVHSTRPTRSSARSKKSFSLDFGDGFTPDWLLELEPPPPPGFFDQLSTTMTSTSPPTEAAKPDFISKPPNPGLKNIASPAPVESLVPWRSSNPIDIFAYSRSPSPASPPDASSLRSTTGPSPGEVNRRAEEFISNFHTRLIRQRQESLERQKRYG